MTVVHAAGASSKHSLCSSQQCSFALSDAMVGKLFRTVAVIYDDLTTPLAPTKENAIGAEFGITRCVSLQPDLGRLSNEE